MKTYTDLEQSKKLAEILPPESADMHWQYYIEENNGQPQWLCLPKDFSINQHNTVSAWSLAALLEVMPTIDDGFEPKLYRSLDKYCCTYESEEDNSGLFRVADNCVDACYEVILKLKEYNLL